jgi:predicted transcriptional regulator of viral defense system
MRKTNNIAKLNDFDVVLLNGKNTRKLEVLNIAIDGVELPITSLERTLIDIVTRPDYAGGVQEIINAYKGAKGKVSTSRIIATLRKFDYMYPYHQAIGFYLERAGYDEKVLARFDKLDKKCDFYLTYQMKDKNYSNRWKVYYPAYLD